MENEELTLNDVINAYRCGLFPMANSREARVFHWYDPPLRGQLSIPDLHIPARLRRTVLQFPYEIKVNTAFEDVITGCAAPGKGRPQTWINEGIKALFIDLHHAGYAHAIEAWQGDELVGGVYGLALGGAFMGESMFSRARDASKIALVHLCARLWKGGFTLLDTQFTNPHLEQFGIYEISREDYLRQLYKALKIKASFDLPGVEERALVREYLARRNT